MSKIAFVHSNFDRLPDENYQTVDERCVRGLYESWPFPTPLYEPCSPQGSGIADAWPGSVILGTSAFERPPAGVKSAATNPPYKPHKLCTAIVGHIKQWVQEGHIIVGAALIRANWDYAVSRNKLLSGAPYAGTVKLCFRPRWFEKKEGEKGPIHNYQWIIFDSRHFGEPITRYWTPAKQI